MVYWKNAKFSANPTKLGIIHLFVDSNEKPESSLLSRNKECEVYLQINTHIKRDLYT